MKETEIKKEIEKSCCKNKEKNEKSGFFWGIFYGIVPHFFCIAFAFFSLIGIVTATTFLKKVLLIPNFFSFLIFSSLLLATFSLGIYFKKKNCLCVSGIKKQWKYVSIFYFTTVSINMLMFFVIIPALASIDFNKTANTEEKLQNLSLKVEIPCSGHSYLITDELKKNEIETVKFENPDIFEISYDPNKILAEEILALEIFKTYSVSVY